MKTGNNLQFTCAFKHLLFRCGNGQGRIVTQPPQPKIFTLMHSGDELFNCTCDASKNYCAPLSTFAEKLLKWIVNQL